MWIDRQRLQNPEPELEALDALPHPLTNCRPLPKLSRTETPQVRRFVTRCISLALLSTVEDWRPIYSFSSAALIRDLELWIGSLVPDILRSELMLPTLTTTDEQQRTSAPLVEMEGFCVRLDREAFRSPALEATLEEFYP